MANNTENMVKAAKDNEKAGRITAALKNQIGSLFMQIIDLQDTNAELTKQVSQQQEHIELLEKKCQNS